MADESSAFRQRLKEDKEKQEQARIARAAATKEEEAVAAESASAWPRSKTALRNAVDSINRDFANEGMPNRFYVEPSRRTDGWSVIERFDLVHKGGQLNKTYWSSVDVDIRANNEVKVEGVLNKVKRSWKVAEADEHAWRNLLEEIYKKDIDKG